MADGRIHHYYLRGTIITPPSATAPGTMTPYACMDFRAWGPLHGEEVFTQLSEQILGMNEEIPPDSSLVLDFFALTRIDPGIGPEELKRAADGLREHVSDWEQSLRETNRGVVHVGASEIEQIKRLLEVFP